LEEVLPEPSGLTEFYCAKSESSIQSGKEMDAWALKAMMKRAEASVFHECVPSVHGLNNSKYDLKISGAKW